MSSRSTILGIAPVISWEPGISLNLSSTEPSVFINCDIGYEYELFAQLMDPIPANSMVSFYSKLVTTVDFLIGRISSSNPIPITMYHRPGPTTKFINAKFTTAQTSTSYAAVRIYWRRQALNPTQAPPSLGDLLAKNQDPKKGEFPPAFVEMTIAAGETKKPKVPKKSTNVIHKITKKLSRKQRRKAAQKEASKDQKETSKEDQK